MSTLVEQVLTLIKILLDLFRRPTPPGPSPASAPGPEQRQAPQPLALPHPEEPPDYTRTMTNTDLDSVLNAWEVSYNVPESERDYWKTRIVIKLDDTLPYPAGTYDSGGKRHLDIRPEWVNPGVIAHEQAHNSYAMLTAAQKAEFSAVYTPLKMTDPLIVLLYSINTYGLTSDVEGHAEIYRYIADAMPGGLKQFYPKLF